MFENSFLNSRPHVAVPPHWLLEPRDRNVTRDDSVFFHCQAEGFPTPTLTWRKVIGEKPFVLYFHFISTAGPLRSPSTPKPKLTHLNTHKFTVRGAIFNLGTHLEITSLTIVGFLQTPCEVKQNKHNKQGNTCSKIVHKR
jgi:hypothetical protein